MRHKSICVLVWSAEMWTLIEETTGPTHTRACHTSLNFHRSLVWVSGKQPSLLHGLLLSADSFLKRAEVVTEDRPPNYKRTSCWDSSEHWAKSHIWRSMWNNQHFKAFFIVLGIRPSLVQTRRMLKHWTEFTALGSLKPGFGMWHSLTLASLSVPDCPWACDTPVSTF